MPDREKIIEDLSLRASGAGADEWMTIKCSTAQEIVFLMKKEEEREETFRKESAIRADTFKNVYGSLGGAVSGMLKLFEKIWEEGE